MENMQNDTNNDNQWLSEHEVSILATSTLTENKKFFLRDCR
jgi:hypothetical protein